MKIYHRIVINEIEFELTTNELIELRDELNKMMPDASDEPWPTRTFPTTTY
jgi:hypothetical protein